MSQGVARAMEGAFAAVKRGGKFLVFGVAPQEASMSLSPFRIYNDEITVLGSMAVLFSFGPALDLMSGGVIDTKALLTTALLLEDFANALTGQLERFLIRHPVVLVIVTHIWQKLNSIERNVTLIVTNFWQLFSRIFGQTSLIVTNIWPNHTCL
jgi:hypothetical protein